MRTNIERKATLERAMDLMRRIERAVTRGWVSATRLGRETVNDPRLVHDMRRGRELRPGTVAKVAHYLDGLEARP